MMMEGSIVGRAFVHAKATVQEAIQVCVMLYHFNF